MHVTFGQVKIRYRDPVIKKIFIIKLLTSKIKEKGQIITCVY